MVPFEKLVSRLLEVAFVQELEEGRVVKCLLPKVEDEAGKSIGLILGETDLAEGPDCLVGNREIEVQVNVSLSLRDRVTDLLGGAYDLVAVSDCWEGG